MWKIVCGSGAFRFVRIYRFSQFVNSMLLTQLSAGRWMKSSGKSILFRIWPHLLQLFYLSSTPRCSIAIQQFIINHIIKHFCVRLRSFCGLRPLSSKMQCYVYFSIDISSSMLKPGWSTLGIDHGLDSTRLAWNGLIDRDVRERSLIHQRRIAAITSCFLLMVLVLSFRLVKAQMFSIGFQG